jgi:ketosteroid isomerase-like protein
MVAATNRVKYVIEQYAAALNSRSEQALGEVRAGVTDAERAILKAREVKVSIEVSSVEVGATTATATCRQNIEATAADGKPIRASGTATFQLVRQPTGWMITEIK